MTARHVLGSLIAVPLLLTAVPRAHACGHCREDKIAATYDYAVVAAAHRRGQVVVFAELRGTIPPASTLGGWIRQQVEGCRGVVPGTVRVSLEPAALSFACGARTPGVSAILDQVRGKLARRGLDARLLEAQAPPRPGARS